MLAKIKNYINIDAIEHDSWTFHAIYNFLYGETYE